MLKRFNQTLKGLRATKVYSIINIIGLALGLTCTLIVLKYIIFEVSTDKYHHNVDRIYYSTVRATPLSEPKLLGVEMFFDAKYNEYPEIEAYTIVNYNPKEKIKYNNTVYNANILAADSCFTSFFSYQLVNQDLKTVLKNPNNIAISKVLASKIFGSKNPIGETLDYDGQTYTIAGILKNFKGNSSMNFNVIAPRQSKRFWSNGGFDFIALHENSSIETLNEKIAHVGRSHFQFPESTVTFKPFEKFYFNTNVQRETDFFNIGSLQSLYILGIIAIFVLSISVFNFINIYNVSLLKRSKELGVKKILGANRRHLALTFTTEVFICILISMVISYFIFLAIIPTVQNITGKEISLNLSSDLNLYLITLLILTVVIAIFPSIKYTLINPIKSIKESFSGKKITQLRKAMMTIQYVITIILIIASISFIKQLNFMLNKDLGFTKNNIIKIPFFDRPAFPFYQNLLTDEEVKKAEEEYRIKSDEMKSNQNFVVDEIQKNPNLKNLSFGDDPLTNWTAPWRNQEGDKDYESIHGLEVTPNFIDLYGLKVLEGRFFNSDLDGSRQKKVVINKKAKEFFEIDNLDNAYILNQYWGAETDPFKVIGVVDNFNFQHLSKSAAPIVMFFHGDKEDNYFMMQIAEGKEKESISFLKSLHEKVNTEKTFVYEFVDSNIEALYLNDKRLARICTIFTLITVFISSLGLFSFSIFDVQQRTREIGVRKVNGAKTSQVVKLLIRNFIILTIIAFVIACPIAWFSVNGYLENFAYKTSISWWIFITAGLFTFTISIIALVFQSWQAARKNPVESLRYE